jgi:hypothetical protein
MFLCLIYPFIYDMTQLRLQGFKTYFSDKWNYFDQLHIWGGFLNIYNHSQYDPSAVFTEVQIGVNDDNEPIFGMVNFNDNAESVFQVRFRKTMLILLTLLMLIKSFFFMRLFRSMAHLVSMML